MVKFRNRRKNRQAQSQAVQPQKPATTTYDVGGQTRTIATTAAGKPVDISRYPISGGYRPVPHIWYQSPIDLPQFTFQTIRAMLMDEGIRLNFATREAPIYGLEFGWEENGVWQEGVKCKDPAVAQFIYRQLQRIWKTFLPDVLRAQIWGWSAGEVTLKLSEETGLIEINEMLSRHPMDCKLLKTGNQRYGVRIERLTNLGHVDLPFPYCWFHAFGAEDGEDYGVSAAYGAYSPWADKWFEGGAKDVRRLFMHKDAYGGVTITYPPGETFIAGYENPIPNKDIARWITEQLRTGGVVQLPWEADEHGNNKWKIERATVTANPQHILDYPKDLDGEIRHGMGIADDVINSGQTGSWNGRAIPMQMFYASLDGWATRIIRDICVQIIDNLLILNFGKKIEYETPFKPLAKQAAEQQAADNQQENATPQDAPSFSADDHNSGVEGQPKKIQQREPLRLTYQGDKPLAMSLDQKVGSGELRVEDVLTASRKAVASRMSIDVEPAKPGCVMLEASKEISDLVGFIQQRIDPASLTEDGCELWPHVTVVYGIQGDDVESVLKFIDKQKPIEIELGEISTFPKDGGSCVLKIEVRSEQLRDFHKQIKQAFEVVSDYDDYRPHITICYCSQAEADKFVGEFIGTGYTQTLSRVKLAMRGDEYYRLLSETDWDERLKNLQERRDPEKLFGGLADGRDNSEFPQDQLTEGIKVESEHTSDVATATEIAKDHLAEDTDAYTPESDETQVDAKPEGLMSKIGRLFRRMVGLPQRMSSGDRWITIGAERTTGGDKTGGSPVKIDKDGKMLTGKFAGKTMDEAFGGKSSDGNSPAKPDSSKAPDKKPDQAIVNVPLNKRPGGSLDSQIDKWKSDTAKQAKADRKTASQKAKDDKAVAKELFDKHADRIAQSTADKTGADKKEALRTIESMVKWEPTKARDFLERVAKQHEADDAKHLNEAAYPESFQPGDKQVARTFASAVSRTDGSQADNRVGAMEAINYAQPGYIESELNKPINFASQRIARVAANAIDPDQTYTKQLLNEWADLHDKLPASDQVTDSPSSDVFKEINEKRPLIIDALKINGLIRQKTAAEEEAEGKSPQQPAKSPEFEAKSPQLEKAPVSSIDTPAQGSLNSARNAKKGLSDRIKQLRERAKKGDGQAQVDLVKAQSSLSSAKQAEEQALDQIEERARQEGKTTGRKTSKERDRETIELHLTRTIKEGRKPDAKLLERYKQLGGDETKFQ